jgi:GNAT superfamily N-acetyltransferase
MGKFIANRRRSEMNISISPASDDDVAQFYAGLRAFNEAAAGKFEVAPIRLCARDESGELLGGLVAEVYWGWLTIGTLWVTELARHRGTGSALLAKGEAEGIRLGAHSAQLDTFDWQAAEFYAQHGYVEFGRLSDFPVGHQRFYLRKDLLAKA